MLKRLSSAQLQCSYPEVPGGRKLEQEALRCPKSSTKNQPSPIVGHGCLKNPELLRAAGKKPMKDLISPDIGRYQFSSL
jgi:hypothetical protein